MHFIIDPRHRMSVCRLLYPTEGMGWDGFARRNRGRGSGEQTQTETGDVMVQMQSSRVVCIVYEVF